MSSSSNHQARQLHIKRFDPRNIKKNRVILITGKRGTGKTTLLKYLMYMMRDKFDIAIGMGGSAASVEMLESFLPKSMVYSYPDVEVVEKMVKLAKMLTENGKRREILLVLDDCSFRKDLFRQMIFREIFMNGRNFGFTFVISAQYIMDLQTDLRSQIDYVFTFRELIKANRKRLHEYFYGMVDNLHDFEQILHTFTCNFECLVMDNTDPSGEIENQLYFYKSPEKTPPFSIGKGVYWALDAQCQKGTGSPSNSLFYKKLAGATSPPAVVAAGGGGAAGKKSNGNNSLVISRETNSSRRK